MFKIQSQYARKVWLHLNRKSQILATIAILAITAFQIYSWHSRSVSTHPSQPQPIQQSPENQSK
jgi:hypothetical protein